MKFENIKEIWIEAEEWCDGFSVDDENSDVIVMMVDGTRWVASFFTIINANKLMLKWYENECERHFWASDMIIVPKFGRKEVECVIRKMIDENNFTSAFNLCIEED